MEHDLVYKNYWLCLQSVRSTAIGYYVREMELGQVLKNIGSVFRPLGPHR